LQLRNRHLTPNASEGHFEHASTLAVSFEEEEQLEVISSICDEPFNEFLYLKGCQWWSVNRRSRNKDQCVANMP